MEIRKQFTLIDAAITLIYALGAGLMYLGVNGWFSRPLVTALLAVLITATLFTLPKIEIRRREIGWLALAAVTAVGFALLRGFFIGDAYEWWLPVGWETAVTGSIPELYRGIPYGGMPLPSLLYGATFSVLGLASDLAAFFIPLLFSGATLILLVRWGEERGASETARRWIVLLFLASPLSAFFAWNPIQEAPLLFFITACLYYLDRLRERFDLGDAVLFYMSLALAGLTKISGLFFLPLAVLPFIWSRGRRVQILVAGLLLLPVAAWLVRNLSLLGDPVFPIFTQVLSGKYEQALAAYRAYRQIDPEFDSWFARIRLVAPQLLAAFPFVMVAAWSMWKRGRWWIIGAMAGFFLFKETFLFTPTQSALRYYYPFLGGLVVYAATGLEHLRSRLAYACLGALALLPLLALPVTDAASAFMAGLESRFLPLRGLVLAVSRYPAALALASLQLWWRQASAANAANFLVGAYAFSVLTVNWISNKTWLAVWPFVLGLIAALAIYAAGRRAPGRLILSVSVAAVVFSVSWGMGAVFTFRQGGLEFPLPAIHADSRSAAAALDSHVSAEARRETNIVITSQPDYFNWFTDYRAIAYPDLGFFTTVPGYSVSLTGGELAEIFRKAEIEYVVGNIRRYEFSPTATSNLEKFYTQLADERAFEPLVVSPEYKIWKVKEN